MLWQNNRVEFVGVGHFPDTVMVRMEDGRLIEVYARELTDGRRK